MTSLLQYARGYASISPCAEGGLETSDEETYDEDGLVNAVRAYVDARDAEKQAKALKTKAQHRLQGVNGTVDKYQVRWTEMNNNHGSLRLDVRGRSVEVNLRIGER